MTSKGLQEADMHKIAEWMFSAMRYRNDAALLGKIREDVKEFVLSLK
jgi:glycine/serine hydroxymethyltransferase